jgi:hypothetical protein
MEERRYASYYLENVHFQVSKNAPYEIKWQQSRR